ncbi:EF-hand domain-containing protein D2 homolog [Schistocerca americana]|uniref:EF-hand domain-containing protein D2 homolog n=1 Tax=Schistocerca americana TaxID=7009 RepID=UPI001F4F6BA6|nr:EF-hand domain-containing protein D2 homolog [Schistocerca americana]XP_047107721.1 EF-hand domain-containing protein D2 homolog [Schistocerca piceifrons]XP_049951359.1 EF-hand domain-containing protein D2 homolog [Schistocerca serialis cubense]
MSADAELSSLLSRRQAINEALDEGKPVSPQQRAKISVYAEFHEFTRKQIKEYEQTFRKYDEGGDGYLDLNEVKRMMERLGAPQTHLSLKAMIKEVDEDGDDRISFREFLLIFRKAAAGELAEDSGLGRLAALTEINVEEVGVTGAKDFFEAKIKEVSRSCKFEEEIRQEQEARRREEAEREQRRLAFRQKAALFQ